MGRDHFGSLEFCDNGDRIYPAECGVWGENHIPDFGCGFTVCCRRFLLLDERKKSWNGEVLLMEYPNNVEILIGLVGKKGTGKTVVANYLREEHDFLEVKFAGLLKEDMSKMLDIPMDIIEPRTPAMREKRESWIHPIWGMTVREMLQKFGTDAIRDNFHSDFWIIRLDMLLKEKFRQGRIVISDVRFKNEIDYVSDNGGYIFKVLRTAGTDEHQSEVDLDDYDYPCFLLENYSTFDRLYEQIDIFIHQLRKPEKEISSPWEQKAGWDRG